MVQGWKCAPVYLQRASAVRWVHSQKCVVQPSLPFLFWPTAFDQHTASSTFGTMQLGFWKTGQEQKTALCSLSEWKYLCEHGSINYYNYN